MDSRIWRNIKVPDKIIEEFLKIIAPLQEGIEEMYLFGSRCRNNWRPDSDYDILVVLKDKNRTLVNKLYDAVMDILLSEGRLISLKIFTNSEFNRLRSIQTPFMKNILKEGIKIGHCNEVSH